MGVSAFSKRVYGGKSRRSRHENKANRSESGVAAPTKTAGKRRELLEARTHQAHKAKKNDLCLCKSVRLVRYYVQTIVSNAN